MTKKNKKISSQQSTTLHLRIPAEFNQRLGEIAIMNHLKLSTFCRYVLMKHVSEYQNNHGIRDASRTTSQAQSVSKS